MSPCLTVDESALADHEADESVLADHPCPLAGREWEGIMLPALDCVSEPSSLHDLLRVTHRRALKSGSTKVFW